MSVHEVPMRRNWRVQSGGVAHTERQRRRGRAYRLLLRWVAAARQDEGEVMPAAFHVQMSTEGQQKAQTIEQQVTLCSPRTRGQPRPACCRTGQYTTRSLGRALREVGTDDLTRQRFQIVAAVERDDSTWRIGVLAATGCGDLFIATWVADCALGPRGASLRIPMQAHQGGQVTTPMG